MYWPALEDVGAVLVQRINAETSRIDMAAWYLSDRRISTALINRIKDDPGLTDCEVRVVAHDSAINRVAVRRSSGTMAAAIVVVEEPHKPLDQRGTRRAPRVRIRESVEVLDDGNAAVLID